MVGVPVGGVAIGLLASVLITGWGWQSLFLIGSIVPLLLVVVLIFALPESVSFLLTRGLDPKGAREIVHKMAPEIQTSAETRYVVSEEKLAGVPMKHLFTEGRAALTLLLWVPFFSSFLILIFVTSWIPTLLRAGGLSMAQAGLAIALNSLGSFFGSGMVGRLMDRYGTYRVLDSGLHPGFGHRRIARLFDRQLPERGGGHHLEWLLRGGEPNRRDRAGGRDLPDCYPLDGRGLGNGDRAGSAPLLARSWAAFF